MRARVRTRPVECWATQLYTALEKDSREWLFNRGVSFKFMAPGEPASTAPIMSALVPTNHGWASAYPGDWIIEGTNYGLTVVPEAAFATLYTIVEE